MDIDLFRYRILLAEDSADDADLIKIGLREAGLVFELRCVDTERAFVAALGENPDVIICDYSMPQFTAIRALFLIEQMQCQIPLIMVSRTIGEEVAVEAMRHGAADYLLKDRLARLPDAIRQAVRRRTLEADKQAAERLLRMTQQTSQQILHSVPIGILLVDASGTVVTLNQAAATAAAAYPGIGLRVGGSFLDSVDAMLSRDRDRAHEARSGLQAVLDRRRRHFCADYEAVAGGARRWFRLRASRLEGEPGGAVVTVEETTRCRQVEEALLLRERAVECSSNAILIMALQDGDFSVSYVNPAFRTMTGYHPSDVLGRSLREVVREGVAAGAFDRLNQALRDNTDARAALRYARKDGSMAWCDVHLSPVGGGDQTQHFVAILTDVTEAREYQQQLEHASNYDALTGLANRNLLRDRLDQAVIHARRIGKSLGIVAIDLDRFKLVNDTAGHAVGDQVLVRVTEMLALWIAPGDTLARTGGDEFLAIVSDVDNESAFVAMIEEMRRKLAEPFAVGDATLMVTASFGAALFPRDAQDAQSAQQHADLALHRAKVMGGNQWRFFTHDLNLRLREQLEIQGQLHTAVAEHQFRLLYQPIVSLVDGRVVGAEALLRWTHPKRGLVLPGEFIGVAEQTGLILPIGEWVLDSVCEQIQLWDGLSPMRLRAAVNVGARQIRHPDFSRMVADTLARRGIDPGRIELEISEPVAMHDDGDAMAALDELRQIGVQLALDDFGVGATSITAMTRLPMDRIKIDRSLISGLPHSRDEVAIVSGVIRVATDLGFVLLAEGVECEAQLQQLRTFGCHEAQGFLLGRPMPAAKFLDFVQSRPTW